MRLYSHVIFVNKPPYSRSTLIISRREKHLFCSFRKSAFSLLLCILDTANVIVGLNFFSTIGAAFIILPYLKLKNVPDRQTTDIRDPTEASKMYVVEVPVEILLVRLNARTLL